jgi:dipeptidyl aminopeptidase/acylaminoacyl peptidase
MQTQENPSGYDENSPNHVDKLKGKFLLIHGSGDKCSFTKLNANDGSIDSSEQTV